MSEVLKFEEQLAPMIQFFTKDQLKNIRRAVIKYLYGVDMQGDIRYSEQNLNNFCREFQIDIKLQSVFKYFIVNLLEHLSVIDNLISAHSQHWKFDRIAKVDLAIIRVCVFEIKLRPSLHSNIIIADAAEIAKEYGAEFSKNFVHGVLDGVSRKLRSKS